MTHRISIITPSLNAAPYVEQAIQSVLHQRYANFEHIVVDGGSSDGTTEILRRYPHLRWVSEPDGGQSDAMNKGFRMSSGAVIGYLNADDYYEPGAFASVAERFGCGAKFVVGQLRVSYEDGSFFLNDPKVTLAEMLKWWEPDAYSFNPAGYFYLREVQEAVGGFNVDNHLAMDVEFLFEAALRCPFVKVDRVLGVFRMVPGTKTFENNARHVETLKFTRRFLSHFDESYRADYERELSEYEHRLFLQRKSLGGRIYQQFLRGIRKLRVT